MASQKQLIILIVITASLTSFLAGYLLTQPSRQSADIIQQQRGALIDRFSGIDSDSTPTPLPPGLLQATTDVALAPTNAPDSNAVLYYHPSNGFVSKLDLETRLNTTISTAQLTGLTSVIWSPNKNRVITVARSSAGPIYKYFDYTSHENGSLGTNIKDAVFSPDSQRVALVRSAGGDSAIEITDFHGKNSKTILKTRLDNIRLSWPNNNYLSFIANDTDAGTQSLYTISENGDLHQLVGGESGLAIRWSPDGTKFLYSNLEDSGVALRVFDVASQQSQDLPFQTSATNCAWTLDQRSVICAIEAQGQTSVNQITFAGMTSKILFSNLIISPKEVFLSHLEDFLIITNTGDQSIWALKLAN